MRIGRRRLPLNALHAFDAVARRSSMRAAAEDLGVTQSAVSHQIRSLEAALGAVLFNRGGRSLRLTHDGAALFEAVNQGLDRIAATARRLGEEAFASSLTIAAPPAFASLWLSPRLPAFLDAYPRLDMTITTERAGAAATSADLAIVFNAERFPGRRVEALTDLEMFPVAAPPCAVRLDAAGFEALRDETLIHDDDGEIWARWFSAARLEQFAPRRNIYAGDAHNALDLARHGAGVAMNDVFLGEAALASGRLVRVFKGSTFPHGRLSLVTAPAAQMSAPAIAFEEWLRRAAAATLAR